MRFAIVGSGPSAFACLWALMDSHIEVTVFDAHINKTNLETHNPVVVGSSPARPTSFTRKLNL
jgi:hypothetical protein